MTTSSPIPAVRDDDPEDVSWALSTSATQWARGDRVEALKWLRRAAEAASEADKDSRALELAKAAADLTTPSMPPPSMVPPPAPSRPAPSRPAPMLTPKAPPAAPSSRPLVPKPAPSKPPQATMKSTPQAKKTSTKPPPAGAKSADETSKRGAVKPKPDIRPRPPAPDEKTDAHIVTEVTRLDARPPLHTPAGPDAESWPTESMDGEELDSLSTNTSEQVYGTERTRIGQPAYRPSDPPPGQNVTFRASQAVQVILWRDPEGHLRVAPRGTTVSAVTIEALLVAPSSDVDLLAWLGPT